MGIDIGKALDRATGGNTGAVIGGGLGFAAGGPAGAALGASLGGGLDANKKNEALSQEQMAFQERMSSTAHQREVQDLVAAGLNPLLSANAGSSSPSGAMPTIQNIAAGAASSAMEIQNYQLNKARQQQELKNLKATENKTKVETQVLSKDIPKSDLINQGYQYLKDKFHEFQKSNSSPEPKYHFYQKPIKLNLNKG